MKFRKSILTLLATCITGTFSSAFSDASTNLNASGVISESSDLDSPVAKLVLKLSNLRNRSGQVCISLFASDEGFPSDGSKAAYSNCLSLADASQNSELVLENIPFGNYALGLFHDENNDKKLNSGAFGIPLEGFGFSNNPKVRIGGPKFNECIFPLIESQQTLSVEIRYLR